MRIMQVIWGLDRAGAERVVVDLSLGLRARGHDASVCCFVGGGPLQAELEAIGVPVFVLPKRGRFDLTIIYRLVRLFRAQKIDVVNTHLITADLWGRLAAKLAGVPVIVTTEHSADPGIYRNRLQYILDTFFGLFTAKIIAVSKRVRDYHLSAQHYRKGLFTVIYNGIDPQKFTHRRNRSGALKAQLGIHDPSAPIIGFIGRLAEQKRPDHFLKVIKKITGEHPGVIGLVVGDGDWRGRLEALVKSLGLEDNVILTGARSDIPHILSILDVLVMTSQQEGFSVAILEAMSAAVPVVATDVGGNAEVITHGMDGFIHPFGDIAGLSGSVLQLLRDQASSGRVGAAGRKRVAGHFTITRMVGQTAALYESLLPAKL